MGTSSRMGAQPTQPTPAGHASRSAGQKGTNARKTETHALSPSLRSHLSMLVVLLVICVAAAVKL